MQGSMILTSRPSALAQAMTSFIRCMVVVISADNAMIFALFFMASSTITSFGTSFPRSMTAAVLVAAAGIIYCGIVVMPSVLGTVQKANEVMAQASDTIVLADTAIESITEMSRSLHLLLSYFVFLSFT